jgi:hypothetical protein
MDRPVDVPPVKSMRWIFLCETICEPTLPSPRRTWTVPAGIPAEDRISETKYWTDKGAFSEGFMMMEFPAARAGASFLIVIRRG